MRKIRLLQKTFSLLTSLSLLFQSCFGFLTTYNIAYAQDVPTPTPEVTVTVVPTQTQEEPTPEPTITVTEEPLAESTPTPTPTETPPLDLNEPEVNEPSAEFNPSVSTDKDDYPPTGTVILTGKDFPANTELRIKVTWPDGQVRSASGEIGQTDTAKTDDQGNLTFFYPLRGEGQEGEYLVEIINGETVLVTIRFTDQLPLPNIVVNEFYSYGSSDWVELYSGESGNIDLSGWVIDDEAESVMLTISSGTSISPGGYLVFNVGERLNNGGDTITLKNPSGNLVDSVSYGGNSSNDVSIPGSGESANRCPNGTGSWTILSTLTSGSANDCPDSGSDGQSSEVVCPAGDVKANWSDDSEAWVLEYGSHTIGGDATTVTWTSFFGTACVKYGTEKTEGIDGQTGSFTKPGQHDLSHIVLYYSTVTPTPTDIPEEPVCGNGIVEGNEQCDDGNTLDGDNCSSSCQWELVCEPERELAINGGFETPVVGSQKWDIFDSGTPGLGWTVNWRENFSSYGGWELPDPAHLELHRSVNGWLPREGLQHAELDSDWNDHSKNLNNEPASTVIYQDIPTIPGNQYTIKFYFSPRPNTSQADNVLEFSWGGEVKDTVSRAGSSNTDWSEHTHTFTATTTPTRLQFKDLGTANSLGTLIDGVSVRCLGPEKGSLTVCKYNDLNKDGQIIEGEPKIGWGMTVVDGADAGETWNTATPANDCLTLEGMDFGEYEVTETEASGWTRSYPADSNSQTAVLSVDSPDAIVNFLNYETPPVCGDGVINQDSEDCDGEELGGADPESNFCTPTCQLVPIYDGEHSCPPGTYGFLSGTYLIDSKAASGVTVPVTSGAPYLFEVSGTYTYNKANATNSRADAAYGTNNNWTSIRGDIGIWGTYRGVTSVLGDFGRGVGVIEWDNDTSFNTDHLYRKFYIPSTDQLQFLISDWYGTWYTNYQNQLAMGDNSGNLTLNVFECLPYSLVNVCKRDTNENLLSGWEVALASEKVDEGLINVSSGLGTDSANLPAGYYLIKVGGTYKYGSNIMIADAGYSYRPAGIPDGNNDWVSGWDLSSGSKGLMVWLNGNPVNWGTFNTAHSYTFIYNHALGGLINFSIYDNYYLDNLNNGNFRYEILKIDQSFYGHTEDGCVTFENVEQGNYYLAEENRFGWEYVSGMGGVAVDETEEEFTLVNFLKPYCGDGEVNQASEQCDDGNNENGDGCDSTCQIEPVKIIASKVVCESESNLPNRTQGTINQNTAQNWVDSHPGCRFEDQ